MGRVSTLLLTFESRQKVYEARASADLGQLRCYQDGLGRGVPWDEYRARVVTHTLHRRGHRLRLVVVKG